VTKHVHTDQPSCIMAAAGKERPTRPYTAGATILHAGFRKARMALVGVHSNAAGLSARLG
jgi:hypothetical protein